MPSLRLFGRSWHTTTDMTPLFTIPGCIVHAVWIIVFGVVISHLDVWRSCTGQGIHFVVVSAALMSVFGLSAVVELSISVIGLRGTCLESGKRVAMIPLLYLQSLLWLVQIVFMVYGTVIIYAAEPTCWSSGRRSQVVRMTKAMIYSTWGFTIVIWLTISIVYNSYQKRDSSSSWEKRLQTLARLCCCTDAVSQSKDDRGAPLPSIAKWMAALFGNVDLSPSDLTEALVLTAASQSLRRKMRIKKALEPVISRVGSVLSGATSDTESVPDDLSSVLEDLDSEQQSEDGGTPVSKVSPAKPQDAPGALEHVCEDGPADGHAVALPEDCPEEWKQKADAAYSRTEEKLQSEQEGAPTAVGSMKDQGGYMAEADDEGRRGRSRGGPSSTTSNMGSGDEADAHANKSGEVSSSGAEDSQHGKRSASRASAREGASGTDSSSGAGASFITLSSVDSQMLKQTTSEDSAGDGQLTPKERFGIKPGRKPPRRQRSLGRPLPEMPREASSSGELDPRARSRTNRDRGDPSLPGAVAGELQAGLNEPEGILPPPDDMTRAFTFDSSIHAGTDARTSIEVQPDLAIAAFPEEIEGWDKRKSVDGVPLERQISTRFPTIITPSAQVQEIVGDDMSVKEAVEEVIGPRDIVDYATLEEAAVWARYACAVYAVEPIQPSKLPANCQSEKAYLCFQPPMSEDRVRQSIMEIADLESEDILYFSHSNEALSHLPYMVVLDRKAKAVVVAIRGTMSLADLVTDAVVHPESIADWLPKATRKAKRLAKDGRKEAFAHAGIQSAANAVLDDLESHGILTALLRPDAVRAASETRRRSQSSWYRNNGSQRRTSAGGAVNGDGAMNGDRGKKEQGRMGRSSQEQSEEGGMRKDTEGEQAGGVWPSEDIPRKSRKRSKANGRANGKDDEDETAATRSQRDEMAAAARDAQGKSVREQGEAAGAAMQKHLDTKGWRLVVTGHSLGAGAATLISLKIRDRYPNLKCWAFSPPGGLVSQSLLAFMEGWCTSVVVGKDAVPRMSVNNLMRLMDEMVTSLARCKYHKLRVLLGGWWNKEKRPPPQTMFHSYSKVPQEARLVLERYYKSTDRKGRPKPMFPPGRILFLRPIKTKTRDKVTHVKEAWDAVWVDPHELMAEGILVSKKMLEHHMIQTTLINAVGYANRHHPDNPKSEREKQQEAREEEDMQSDLQEVVVDQGESLAQASAALSGHSDE